MITIARIDERLIHGQVGYAIIHGDEFSCLE